MPIRTASAPAKKISAAEAASLVQSGFWLDYGGCLAQPDVFDCALAARVQELSNVGIRSSLAAKPRAVLECDPEGEHFQWHSWHFSAYERAKSDAGICYHMPPNLGEIDDYYRRFIEPIDIVVLKVRPADANGYFSFGAMNGWMRALVERAKTLIVETSTAVPFVYGVGILMRRNKSAFAWPGRQKHPATDPLNALLSFAYTLVGNELAGLVEGLGLDSYIGSLHQVDYGRRSLALDLVEPFRAPLADRFVLTLINRRQFSEADFEPNDKDGLYLRPESCKRFLGEYEYWMLHAPIGKDMNGFRPVLRATVEGYAAALRNNTAFQPWLYRQPEPDTLDAARMQPPPNDVKVPLATAEPVAEPSAAQQIAPEYGKPEELA